MTSIFSKIIAGEIPSYKIAEDNYNYAFLDINPLKRGHTLVIPKKEVDYLFDLDEEDYTRLMSFSKKVSLAIKEVIPCLRVGVAVLGLEVPHAHIHLVPLDNMGDLNFANDKLQLSTDEMNTISKDIAKKFKK